MFNEKEKIKEKKVNKSKQSFMVGKFKDFSIGGGVVKMAPPLLSPASSKIPRGDILEKSFPAHHDISRAHKVN